MCETFGICTSVIRENRIYITEPLRRCGRSAMHKPSVIRWVQQLDVARRLAVKALFTVNNSGFYIMPRHKGIDVGIGYFRMLLLYSLKHLCPAERKICRNTGIDCLKRIGFYPACGFRSAGVELIRALHHFICTKSACT